MLKSGTATLPLHGGKAPQWLFQRMKALSKAIIELMIIEFGTKELLRRLSDPFWFQSLGCLLGFDWHSSGVTTTVTGAIKEGIKGMEKDLGLFVAGGKAKVALQTPNEIIKFAEKEGFDPNIFIYVSKLTAKVDNVAIQDGFNLYHHSIFFTTKGDWCVIQQGMNESIKRARRYHWLSFTMRSFVEEPHYAVCCDVRTKTLNFTAKEAKRLRETTVEIAKYNPDKILKELIKINHLSLPARHEITLQDLKYENLRKILLKTYESHPSDFESLLLTRGLGAKTLRALALTSELIYGTPLSYQDPAKFSFAHGGKDKIPYPVNIKIYDRTIDVMKKAIEEAKIGRQEKKETLKRLSLITEVL